MSYPRRLVSTAVGCAVCLLALLAAIPDLDLGTRHDTPRERRTLEQVRRLAAAYDLSRFTKTRAIVIEEGAMAHACPVLTMNHLPVILLEWQAMEDLVGAERARRVMEWKREDHYTAVYAVVLERRPELEGLLGRHGVHW